MFNNRFNSIKKDPLVEAVQSAMQDGDLRRQAEALVNEEFGVYSRKAVVREQLAAYDARLEEAYKCMKEGEKKDEKKEDKPKADYSKMREKMVGKGKDLETTRKIVGEAKKLADKDYDKDGKIESPKDEVWGSRFRAAKMAGKMEEEQIDEISHKLALKAMKKSDERGEEEYDRDMTDDRLSDPKTHWDRAKRLRGHMKRKFGNKTIKTGGSDNLSSKSYEQGGGERRRADKLKKGPRAGMISAKHRDKLKDNIKYSLGKHKKPNLPEEVDYSAPDRAAVTRDNKPSTPAQTNAATSGPSAADKAALTNKIKTMQEAAYSAKAARAGKDIGKPGKEFKKIAAKAGEKYGSEERGKKVAGAILKKIRAKHMKEDSSFNAAPVMDKSVNEMKSSWNDVLDAFIPSGVKSVASSAMKASGLDTGASTKNAAVKTMARRGAEKAPAAAAGKSVPAIKPVQTPSAGLGSKPTTTEPTTFKSAFAAARKEAGGGTGQFTWKGKQYQTNIAPAKGAEKYISTKQQKVTSVGKPSATTTSTTTPGSITPAPSAQAPASSVASTAGMTSAAQKVGISQTPSMSGTEFGAGKDMSKSSMPDTQAKGSVTTAPEPAKSTETSGGVSSALADKIKPSQLASNPANLSDKNVTKGREAAAPASAPASDAEKKWNERPRYDYSGGKGGVPMNESVVSVGSNKYRIV